MKAPAADQTRLLVVQEHDKTLHQLAHKLATLPAIASQAQAEELFEQLGELVAGAGAAVHDIQRELTAVEDEVTKVEQRRRRDTERLESGGGTSRELQALTAEVEALDRRRDVLEDSQLEVMERLEEATNQANELRQRQDKAASDVAAAAAQLAEQSKIIAADQAAELALRTVAAEGLDEALMVLYERLRERLGGVGAAALLARRCDGCRLEVTPVFLAEIRGSADDVVLRCEECSRILVRGPGSGL
ncbi:MAG: C4-type zinc ribbon domain-containing protein [Micrococcales bacterium]|nr:C4-type zinc ribbon domain-containing protein [Micrococcales bacterium]